MIELYEQRGMSHEDASTIINIMSQYRDFFVDIMMVEELGLQVPPIDANPWWDGFITFSSFIIFGFFPLATYLIFPILFPNLDAKSLFKIAYATTALTLFALGAIKSRFSMKSWIRSGIEMVIIGSFVAFIAYCIGALTNALIGLDLSKMDLKNDRNIIGNNNRR